MEHPEVARVLVAALLCSRGVYYGTTVHVVSDVGVLSVDGRTLKQALAQDRVKQFDIVILGIYRLISWILPQFKFQGRKS